MDTASIAATSSWTRKPAVKAWAIQTWSVPRTEVNHRPIGPSRQHFHRPLPARRYIPRPKRFEIEYGARWCSSATTLCRPAQGKSASRVIRHRKRATLLVPVPSSSRCFTPWKPSPVHTTLRRSVYRGRKMQGDARQSGIPRWFQSRARQIRTWGSISRFALTFQVSPTFASTLVKYPARTPILLPRVSVAPNSS